MTKTMISVLLEEQHNRKDYKCGIDSLDNYLQRTVKKDIKNSLAVCYVLVQDNDVIGYYTISTGSANLENIPEDAKTKRLIESGYDVPIILVGRLALDINYQGKKLGRKIMLDCILRSYEASKIIAAWAICVDPIDENARAFYEKFGFISLVDSHRMFLPIKTIETLLNRK